MVSLVRVFRGERYASNLRPHEFADHLMDASLLREFIRFFPQSAIYEKSPVAKLLYEKVHRFFSFGYWMDWDWRTDGSEFLREREGRTIEALFREMDDIIQYNGDDPRSTRWMLYLTFLVLHTLGKDLDLDVWSFPVRYEDLDLNRSLAKGIKPDRVMAFREYSKMRVLKTWEVDLRHGLIHASLLSDGRVMIGSSRSRLLYVLSHSEDDMKVFELEQPLGLNGITPLPNGGVVLSDVKNRVYNIFAETVLNTWKLSSIVSGVIPQMDHIRAFTVDGNIYALYPDGEVLKVGETALDLMLLSSVMDDGTLLFSSDSEVVRITADGELLNRWKVSHWYGSIPVVLADGRLFVCGYGKVHVFSPDGAEKKWKIGVDVVTSPLLLPDDKILVFSPRKIFLIDPDWGIEKKWDVDEPPVVPVLGVQSLLLPGRTVLVGPFASSIYHLDLKEGLVDAWPCEGGLSSSPLLMPDGCVLVPGWNKVYLLG